MDSITRAPVSSFFSETLGGLATIRAFGQKSRFMELMLGRMDVHNNTFLVLSAANRWLGVALVRMPVRIAGEMALYDHCAAR